MDESDHLTLVNAGDEEVVSQEEGGRERRRGRRRRVLLRERYRGYHDRTHFFGHGLWRVSRYFPQAGLPFSLGPTGDCPCRH